MNTAKYLDSIGLEFECFLFEPIKFKQELGRPPYNYELIDDAFQREAHRFKAELIKVEVDGSVRGELDYPREWRKDSLFNFDDFDWSRVCSNVNCLEIKSKWKYNDNIINDINDFAVFLFRYFKQNKTCGNHIHVSFVKTKNVANVFFTYKKFWDRFIEDYKSSFRTNEKYMKRLENSYCKPAYNRTNIRLICDSRYVCGDRYYAINLLSFGKHGTIEFRIMPHADNSNEYINQIKWVLDEINIIFSEKNNLSRNYVYFLDSRKINEKYIRV